MLILNVMWKELGLVTETIKLDTRKISSTYSLQSCLCWWSLEEKNTVNRFIEAILGEHDYRWKVIKKNFNKNLVMSAKDEQIFQSSNKCWMCDNLFDTGDNKVRDHCIVI